MKLGFLAGALLATWLSLTYPAQMTAVFDRLTMVFHQILQPASSSSSPSSPDNDTGMIEP